MFQRQSGKQCVKLCAVHFSAQAELKLQFHIQDLPSICQIAILKFQGVLFENTRLLQNA